MSEDHMTIFSKPDCTYCIKAKQFLIDLKLQFMEETLSPNDINYTERRNTYNQKKCPLIGGYQELVNACNTLRLHDLYKSSGLKC